MGSTAAPGTSGTPVRTQTRTAPPTTRIVDGIYLLNMLRTMFALGTVSSAALRPSTRGHFTSSVQEQHDALRRAPIPPSLPQCLDEPPVVPYEHHQVRAVCRSGCTTTGSLLIARSRIAPPPSSVGWAGSGCVLRTADGRRLRTVKSESKPLPCERLATAVNGSLNGVSDESVTNGDTLFASHPSLWSHQTFPLTRTIDLHAPLALLAVLRRRHALRGASLRAAL